MDEAGSRVHITNMDVPKNIVSLEISLEEVRDKKNAVVKKQKYEEAAKLRDDEKRIEKELIQAQEKWQEKLKLHREVKGEIGKMSITKTPTGKYYVSIFTEQRVEKLPKTNNCYWKYRMDSGLSATFVACTP